MSEVDQSDLEEHESDLLHSGVLALNVTIFHGSQKVRDHLKYHVHILVVVNVADLIQESLCVLFLFITLLFGQVQIPLTHMLLELVLEEQMILYIIVAIQYSAIKHS